MSPIVPRLMHQRSGRGWMIVFQTSHRYRRSRYANVPRCFASPRLLARSCGQVSKIVFDGIACVDRFETKKFNDPAVEVHHALFAIGDPAGRIVMVCVLKAAGPR